MKAENLIYISGIIWALVSFTASCLGDVYMSAIFFGIAITTFNISYALETVRNIIKDK